MTAIDDEATRKEAMKAGCVAYLKKPFAHFCWTRSGKRWPSESADPAGGRFAPKSRHSERNASFSSFSDAVFKGRPLAPRRWGCQRCSCRPAFIIICPSRSCCDSATDVAAFRISL